MKEMRHDYESQIRSIATARNDVADFARACGFCENEVADIRLAAGEACVNCVEHARLSRGTFTVSCGYEEEILSVSVAGFSGGLAARDDRATQNLAPKPRSGLGLMLIRALMDESELEIRHDSGPTMTMRKLRSPHGGASSLREA
ncbi:MAG: ATP-binding protein [Candidatus Eremiobacteraeota bacterium]|nr:ATP-binding protein [Candidatus Eremiobacteraeota bacterium]